LASYARAAEIDPNNLAAQVEKGDLLLEAFLGSSQRPKFLYDSLRDLAKQLTGKPAHAFDVLRIEGALHLADGNYGEAIASYQEALRQRKDHEQTAMALIECLYANKQMVDAESKAREWIRANPKSSNGYDRLYGILSYGGKNSEALEVLQAKQQAFPQDSATVIALARHYATVSKDPQKSKAQLDFLTATPDKFPDGALAAAGFLMDAEQLVEAIDLMEKAISANNPRTLDLRKLLAECYQRTNQLEKASQTLEAAGQSNPSDDSIQVAQAIVHIAKGNKASVEKALGLLDNLKRKESKDPRLDFHRGRALFLLNRETEAVSAMQEAIRKQRGNLDARFALVAHLLTHGRQGEALQLLDQIDSYAPQNARAMIYRLQALRLSNRFDEALNLARQGLQTFPENQELRLEQGLLMLAAKRFTEAQKILYPLYTKGGRGPYIIVGLLQSYVGSGQGAAAKALIEREIALQPNAIELKVYRADLLRQLGETRAALSAYEALNDSVSPSTSILINMGDLYAKDNQSAKAYSVLEKAASIAQDPSIAYTAWISAASLVSDGEQISRACQSWMKKQPKSLVALNNCAFALAETRTNLDQAESFALTASKLQPRQPNLLDTLGYIYIQKNKFGEASQIYRNLCQEQPDNPTFKYHYALAQAGAGQNSEARQRLQEALRVNPSASLEKKIRQKLASL
jgi:tetratricopeptide (TPR) repeat protein